MNVGSPAAKPVVPTAVPVSQTTAAYQAAANRSLFDDLPSSRQPVHPPPATSSSAHAAYRPSASTAPRPAVRAKKSLLGPGLLIAIPNVLGISLSVLLMISIINNDNRSSPDMTVFFVLFGVSLVSYLAVLGGAISMTMSGPRWLSITTCIFAIFPTLLMGTFCFGLVLYPFSLGGAIWGLVALFAKPKSAPAYASGSGGYSPPGGQSTGYLQRARDEAARQNTSSLSDEAGSATSAILAIVGGVAMLAITVIIGIALYSSFTAEATRTGISRPGKAIAGAIFCAITGFSLLAKGASCFMRKQR